MIKSFFLIIPNYFVASILPFVVTTSFDSLFTLERPLCCDDLRDRPARSASWRDLARARIFKFSRFKSSGCHSNRLQAALKLYYNAVAAVQRKWEREEEKAAMPSMRRRLSFVAHVAVLIAVCTMHATVPVAQERYECTVGRCSTK
jgi:hypothetical protein